MKRGVFWSPALLAVALSPAFLQPVSCEPSGNPTLASLEIEANGLNRVVGFSGAVTAYDVWTTTGVDTILVRASTVSGGARVNWRLLVGGEITSGSLGIGGGEATLSIPPDTSVQLTVEVSDGGLFKSYNAGINQICSGSECNDNDPCSTDVCNGNTCEFAALPGGAVCYAEGIAGTCSAGICAPNPTRAWGEPDQFPSGCCAYNNPPCMVADSGGNVTAVFQSRVAGQQSGVIHATRYTLGVGWSPAVTLSESGIALGPQCVIDANDNITAVWTQKQGITSATPNYLWSARHTPANGWGPAMRIDPLAPDAAQSPSMATDPYGNVIVVWLQRDGGLASVWSSRYTPTAGWGTPAVIETNFVDAAKPPRVSVDDSGNAIAVWSYGALIVANRYTPGGGWGEFTTLINNGFDTSSSPRVAVAANGNATAVWRQTVSGSSTLWANNYTPGGGWALYFDELPEDPVIIGLGGSNADVLVDAGGNATALWNDSGAIVARRYSVGNGWSLVDAVGVGSGPKAAIGAGGDVAVVWRGSGEWVSNRFTSGAWGAAEAISDPIGSSNIGYPVVDFAGNVTAVWEVILGVTGQYSVQWSNRFE